MDAGSRPKRAAPGDRDPGCATSDFDLWATSVPAGGRPSSCANPPSADSSGSFPLFHLVCHPHRSASFRLVAATASKLNPDADIGTKQLCSTARAYKTPNNTALTEPETATTNPVRLTRCAHRCCFGVRTPSACELVLSPNWIRSGSKGPGVQHERAEARARHHRVAPSSRPLRAGLVPKARSPRLR